MGEMRALVKLLMQLIRIVQVLVQEKDLKAAPYQMIPLEEALWHQDLLIGQMRQPSGLTYQVCKLFLLSCIIM